MKQPCVYIFANRRNGTLYTGVTSNLPKRAFEHRAGLVKGFSAKYGCKILVWYEIHATMIDAITREKQIKAGSRTRKLALIEALNPDWKDLYDTLIEPPEFVIARSAATKQSRLHPRTDFWIASLRSQ
jgi:putative endonuclease